MLAYKSMQERLAEQQTAAAPEAEEAESNGWLQEQIYLMRLAMADMEPRSVPNGATRDAEYPWAGDEVDEMEMRQVPNGATRDGEYPWAGDEADELEMRQVPNGATRDSEWFDWADDLDEDELRSVPSGATRDAEWGS